MIKNFLPIILLLQTFVINFNNYTVHTYSAYLTVVVRNVIENITRKSFAERLFFLLLLPV